MMSIIMPITINGPLLILESYGPASELNPNPNARNNNPNNTPNGKNNTPIMISIMPKLAIE